MTVTDSIKYIGVDDTDIELFESQYPVGDIGVTYNSYVIMDEKITVMDTVDKRGSEGWQKNLSDALGGKEPEYLVVQHLEPDHSGNIKWIADRYPSMKLIGSAKTKAMLPQFFDIENLEERFISVAEGEEISIGSHTLQFFMAPMVHWPEVMVTYEKSEKVLFSADGFGTFGASTAGRAWEDDALHYYGNIVGKYGASVQALLKKAATLDISMICPLHGPVLKENLGFYINKYQLWSTYTPEEKGIFMPYASIHGHTKEAVEQFAEELRAMGEKVVTMDLTEEDVSEAVESAFIYDRIIFAACTYDGELFPPMMDLLYHLRLKNFQNRKVGLIENGSWGPVAARKMREQIEMMKDMEIVEPVVTIKSVRKAENDADFKALAEAMKG
ncbi:MAG: FprA family A-type flavoprotein [Lachnospiraceae bacterium]|nr:FprA family A-type flavoprotein [Lachnospiraceae bacterium]